MYCIFLCTNIMFITTLYTVCESTRIGLLTEWLRWDYFRQIRINPGAAALVDAKRSCMCIIISTWLVTTAASCHGMRCVAGGKMPSWAWDCYLNARRKRLLSAGFKCGIGTVRKVFDLLAKRSITGHCSHSGYRGGLRLHGDDPPATASDPEHLALECMPVIFVANFWILFCLFVSFCDLLSLGGAHSAKSTQEPPTWRRQSCPPGSQSLPEPFTWRRVHLRGCV